VAKANSLFDDLDDMISIARVSSVKDRSVSPRAFDGSENLPSPNRKASTTSTFKSLKTTTEEDNISSLLALMSEPDPPPMKISPRPSSPHRTETSSISITHTNNNLSNSNGEVSLPITPIISISPTTTTTSIPPHLIESSTKNNPEITTTTTSPSEKETSIVDSVSPTPTVLVNSDLDKLDHVFCLGACKKSISIHLKFCPVCLIYYSYFQFFILFFDS
jgi:hypothetical protein